jgi:hypothetical protein
MTMRSVASWALVAALGSAVLLASAGPASARGWLERLQTKLELNDDQMKAIQAIHDRDADTQRQLFRAMHQAQADLRRMALNTADPTAIQQKEAEVAGLMAQSLQIRTRHLQEIAPLLTQEQRDRLAAMQMGPGKGRPGHGRPGHRSSS